MAYPTKWQTHTLLEPGFSDQIAYPEKKHVGLIEYTILHIEYMFLTLQFSFPRINHLIWKSRCQQQLFQCSGIIHLIINQFDQYYIYNIKQKINLNSLNMSIFYLSSRASKNNSRKSNGGGYGGLSSGSRGFGGSSSYKARESAW